MASRPFEISLQEWELQDSADFEDAAEALFDAGIAVNVYREIRTNGDKVRRMEIHRPDMTAAIKAETGQWLVMLGSLVEVLSAQEHAEKYPTEGS